MATITVTNTVDTDYGVAPVKGSLRAAIEEAKSGDVVRFSPKLANQTIALKRRYVIDKDITIDASNAPGLTLDGKNREILIQVDGNGREFNLRGVTLVNGFHEYNGAGIRVQSSNAKVVVEDSNFRQNEAQYGAAIWAKNGADVKVLDSTFEKNVSTGTVDSTAGAISVFSDSKLTVKDSQFIGNRGFAGGAIGTIFTDLLVEDSTFINNQSRGLSGAVHADGASIPSDPRYYQGDKPRDRKGGNIRILNSHFEGNSAKSNGGGVGIWGYDQDYVTVKGNQFVENKVRTGKSGIARGGGLRISGKLAKVEDNYFEGNRSDIEGGAIFYNEESKTVITDSVFVRNQAGERGGAISHFQWDGPGTEINNSVFKGNRAPDGGAIFKGKPTQLTIQRSEFSNNGPEEIGGVEKNLTVEKLASGLLASYESSEKLGTTNTNNKQSGNNTPSPSMNGEGESTIGEYGTVNLNHKWKTIALDESYINPVVIVSDPTSNGVDPVAVRLRNVSKNTFQISLQEPQYKDGSHTNETVSYLVMEAGDWTLDDGTRISAGTHDSGRLTSAGFDKVNLKGFDSTPTVLSQVQTYRGSDWVTTRTKGQSANGFQLAMQEVEALNDGGHADETLGWLAIEKGIASDGDTLLQGGTTNRSYDEDRSVVRFGERFDAAPSVIAKLGSFDGPNTANLRIDGISRMSFGASVREEQSLDNELNHVNESVSFLALEGQSGNLTGLSV